MKINLSLISLFMLTLATNIIGPVNLKVMSGLNIQNNLKIFVILALFHIVIVSTRMVTWFKILKRVNLSIAYPVISLTFPVMLTVSHIFFDEEITLTKTFGVVLIISGLLFNSYNNA